MKLSPNERKLLTRHRLLAVCTPLRRALRRRQRPSLLRFDYLHLWTLARGLRGLLNGNWHRVLDVGCGDSPYRCFLSSEDLYVRLDRDPACNPDIVADALDMPITSEACDLVMCLQMADFVEAPEKLIAECYRVLRPGGQLILSVPFLWPSCQTGGDRYRYSLGSLQWLLRGFRHMEVVPNGNSWQTAVQVALCCAWNTLGAVGVPLYLIGNVCGRLLGSIPSDSLITTGYTASAFKPVVPSSHQLRRC